jgi:Acetyltransferase (GNAT) domain
MKASLTNETTRAFFPRPLVRADAIGRSSTAVRDGMTLTPWSDGLPMWRAALKLLSGATFYHCEPWIEALRGSYPLHLVIATLHHDGDLRAAAVFARSKGLFGTRLVSLPFSDCGEPLAIDEQSRTEFLRVLASSRQANSIEVRGAAGPAPWQNVDCFAHWTLDLKRPFGAISAGFGRTIRSGIKRGIKDHIVVDRGTSAAYLARFFELQLRTRRRLGIPPQPFKFFSTVHEKFAQRGDCEVWFATLHGRDEAGLVLLRNGDQLCYKWGARAENCHSGANHLLVSNMLEAHAGKAGSIDFGRCDSRNPGLVRSKAELGCVQRPLPYAFFPTAPRSISSEVLSGPARILSSAWKRLPLPVTRVLGEALYRYLS